MPYHEFLWTPRAIEKIEDNGLTVADVEFAVQHALRPATSRRSGLRAYVGPNPDGGLIFVVYDRIDAVQISIITAFEIASDE